MKSKTSTPTQNRVIAIDPNQFNSTINLDFGKVKYILDGLCVIRVKLMAQTTIMMVFDVIQRSPSDWLEKQPFLSNEFFEQNLPK